MLRPLARCIALLVLLVFAVLPASAAPALHWTRLRVTRALPSEVFTRLGIGHNTRRGYTRDGAKKGDPDPTFPAGLTDVVPLDTEHLLLVRGTNTGVAAFKLQVAQAEAQVTEPRWHVTAALVRVQNGQPVPVGPAAVQDVPDGTPTVLTLGTDANHLYQVRVLPNAQGLLQVVWQRGLLLSGGAAPGVLAPDIAWSAGISRTVAQGGTASFDDLAADRVAARAALGLPPEAQGSDYAVRITAALLAPPPAAPAPAPNTDTPAAP